jgi:hypothetical protein
MNQQGNKHFSMERGTTIMNLVQGCLCIRKSHQQLKEFSLLMIGYSTKYQGVSDVISLI